MTIGILFAWHSDRCGSLVRLTNFGSWLNGEWLRRIWYMLVLVYLKKGCIIHCSVDLSVKPQMLSVDGQATVTFSLGCAEFFGCCECCVCVCVRVTSVLHLTPPSNKVLKTTSSSRSTHIIQKWLPQFFSFLELVLLRCCFFFCFERNWTDFRVLRQLC